MTEDLYIIKVSRDDGKSWIPRNNNMYDLQTALDQIAILEQGIKTWNDQCKGLSNILARDGEKMNSQAWRFKAEKYIEPVKEAPKTESVLEWRKGKGKL